MSVVLIKVEVHIKNQKKKNEKIKKKIILENWQWIWFKIFFKIAQTLQEASLWPRSYFALLVHP